MPYMVSGTDYTPFDHLDLVEVETLPPHNFTVKFDGMRQKFYLERATDFTNVKKLYGNTNKIAERILNTFRDRNDRSTGVLLAGVAGSGKTLLARTLSINGYEHGYPTLIVTSSYAGEMFNKFIQNITQPAIVVFDEFEKVYKEEEQEQMLTLFDGVFQTQKLFVITCNDPYRVNNHMKNRPGRMFYSLNFEGLEQDVIVEFLDENLLNKNYLETLVKICSAATNLTFDMLHALVEEVNRYDEDPAESIKLLNFKIMSDKVEYTPSLFVDGTPVKSMYYDDSTVRINFNSFTRVDISTFIGDKRGPFTNWDKNDKNDKLVEANEYDDESIDAPDFAFTMEDIVSLSRERIEFKQYNNNHEVKLELKCINQANVYRSSLAYRLIGF